MKTTVYDTIAAISSAYSKAGISIIRISGKEAISKVNSIFRGADLTKVAANTINFGHILNKNNEYIDEVLVSVFHQPKSFTAEDVVEINCHGGILVTRQVLERILETGIRLARNGEFSERAFLNGRIDLVQAEAIAGMIEAKNEHALKIARDSLKGDVSKEINQIRSGILDIIANIEVGIDYPEYDEAHVKNDELKNSIDSIIKKIDECLIGSNKTRMLSAGIKTVIVGKPNVGKSSLLNAIMEEERAIVTEIAGTTRDLVEGTINIGGVTLDLIDTAGIRESSNKIEVIGINKSKKAIIEAELILLLLDNSTIMSKTDYQLLELTKDKTRIVVINKCDLENKCEYNEKHVAISIYDNFGIKELENEILEILELKDLRNEDYHYLTNTRQIAALKNAKEELLNAKTSIDSSFADIYVVDLIASHDFIAEILGLCDDEEIIKRIFSKFCLGK